MTRASCLTMALAAVAALAPATARAQYYGGGDVIYVDPRIIRGEIGFEYHGIGNINFPSTPGRDALGLHLKVGTPFVSLILRAVGATRAEGGFELYDEVFLDMGLGALTSEPLKYFSDAESSFFTDADFGWDIAAGWRFSRFTVMGGMRLMGVVAFVGGTQQPGSDLIGGAYPFLGRFEYALGDNYRLIAMAWASGFGPAKLYGAEVDFPIAKRFWITAKVNTIFADVAPANAGNNVFVDGIGTQFIVALKVGPEY